MQRGPAYRPPGKSNGAVGLLRRCLCRRAHRYEDATLGLGAKLDAAIDQGEQRVIPAQPDIRARVPFGAALARDDVAGKHLLAAENLQTQPLAVGVAAVAGRAACLLMSHRSFSFSWPLRNQAL